MPCVSRPRRFAFKNPYADLGVSFVGLEFTDTEKESAFALGFSKRLATLCQFVFLAVSLCELTWMLLTLASPSEYNPSSDMVAVGIFILTGIRASIWMCLALFCRYAARRKSLRARVVELGIVVGTLLAIAISVFYGRHAMTIFLRDIMGIEASRLGSQKEDSESFQALLALSLDAVLTFSSISPIRWSSTWPLHVIIIFGYPAMTIGLRGEPSNDSMTVMMVLGLLGICAMMGKRMSEAQERRVFSTIAFERTLRAETEFKLSQQEEHRQPGPASLTATLQSQLLFDGTAETTGAALTLERVEVVAKREQWLIQPEEVEINLTQMLGQGAFGVVVEGSVCGLPAAFKLCVEGSERHGVQQFASLITELRVLRKLRHPNIVIFQGAVIDTSLSELALVMELVTGPNLQNFILGAQAIPTDADVYVLTGAMARALQYMHRHKPAIVHGDLKPNNILVEVAAGATPRAKLTDFGLSRILSGEPRRLGGTLAWMAPELMQFAEVPNTAVDTYGLGRIIYFLLSGKLPFIGCSRSTIRKAVSCGDIPASESPPKESKTGATLRKVAAACCSLDVADRPSMERVCSKLQEPGLAAAHPSLALELWGHNSRTIGDVSKRPGGMCSDGSNRAYASAGSRSATSDMSALALESSTRSHATTANEDGSGAHSEFASKIDDLVLTQARWDQAVTWLRQKKSAAGGHADHESTPIRLCPIMETSSAAAQSHTKSSNVPAASVVGQQRCIGTSSSHEQLVEVAPAATVIDL